MLQTDKRRSVHVLDKLIAMARQCQKALNPFVFQLESYFWYTSDDSNKFWKSGLGIQKAGRLDVQSLEHGFGHDRKCSMDDVQSLEHGFGHDRKGSMDHVQPSEHGVGHDQKGSMDHVQSSEHGFGHDRKSSTDVQSSEHEVRHDRKGSMDVQSSEHGVGHDRFKGSRDVQSSEHGFGHDRKGSMQEAEFWYPCEGFEEMLLEDWSANELMDCDEESESDEEFKEAELQKDSSLLSDTPSAENADDKASGAEEEEEEEESAFDRERCNKSRPEAKSDDVILDQYEVVSVEEEEETELPYPSDLFEDIHSTDGIIPREQRKHERYPSDLFDDIRSMDGIPREQRKHDHAVGSFKEDDDDDDVGFTGGLQFSGKVCTQFSVVKEVRKALKEYYAAQQERTSKDELNEVHDDDIRFAMRQKIILEPDFKPLMEELIDSFAEYPSPSCSTNKKSDENSPLSEFSEEDHQSLSNDAATEDTTHDSIPLKNQAKSEMPYYHDDHDDHHDVVFSELPNFRQVDLWKPLVEEDLDGVGALDQIESLEFLFPAQLFKYEIPILTSEPEEDDDEKKESVLLRSAKVPEAPTSYNPKVVELLPGGSFRAPKGGLEPLPGRSFRAPKGGLKKLTGVTTKLSRSKRTVTFADDMCDKDDDEEDRCFPSLKSWEIEDDESEAEPRLPISTSKLGYTKQQQQQPDAEKPPSRFHETSILAQSRIDHSRTGKTKPATSSSDSFPSKTGVMQNMISSFLGRLFSSPRTKLAVASKAKDLSSRSRVRHSHDSWMPPKEMNFGGSARTDAQQIKTILRASRRTFAGLTTSDFLSQELD